MSHVSVHHWQFKIFFSSNIFYYSHQMTIYIFFLNFHFLLFFIYKIIIILNIISRQLLSILSFNLNILRTQRAMNLFFIHNWARRSLCLMKMLYRFWLLEFSYIKAWRSIKKKTNPLENNLKIQKFKGLELLTVGTCYFLYFNLFFFAFFRWTFEA